MLDFININIVNFFSNYNIYYSAIIAYITYTIMYLSNIWEDDDSVVACLVIHLISHIWFLTKITTDNDYFILTPFIYVILFYVITICIRPYVLSFARQYNERWKNK